MPTFKPDTVSNPTNEVIEFFGIKGDEASRVVWQLAGCYADMMWGRPARIDHITVATATMKHFGFDRAGLIRDRLWANMERAITWARAQGKASDA